MLLEQPRNSICSFPTYSSIYGILSFHNCSTKLVLTMVSNILLVEKYNGHIPFLLLLYLPAAFIFVDHFLHLKFSSAITFKIFLTNDWLFLSLLLSLQQPLKNWSYQDSTPALYLSHSSQYSLDSLIHTQTLTNA